MVRRLIKRSVIVGAAIVGAEAAYAVLRPAPELEEFDPSGVHGKEGRPSLTVAVLGDSSVTAPGVSGPEDIWVSILARRLGERFRVDLRSFAIGGSMAHNLIADQVAPALAVKPDLILVSVGANDVIKGVGRRRFHRNLTTLVSMLSESGAVIIQSGVGDLASIPRLRPPLRSMIGRRARVFDAIHKEVAAEFGTHVVDQRSDPLEPWYRDRELWAPDLFHVSRRGHELWADIAWRAVEPLLPQLEDRLAQTS